MTTTLVVFAHPEPRSFTAAWAAASVAAARRQGGQVLTSDLYELGFDAADRAALYPAPFAVFDPLRAQKQASERRQLPLDVAREVSKLFEADQVIFHFPVWWFAPPAILKGWLDRVLVHGLLHDLEHRFDRGHLQGKRALVCVTAGATAAESGPDGVEGNLRYVLWPFFQTLRYIGMTVLEPVVAYGVHGYHEGDAKAELEGRLRAMLGAQNDLVARLGERAELPFNADADFDAEGRLHPDAPVHWPFIDNRNLSPGDGSA